MKKIFSLILFCFVLLTSFCFPVQAAKGDTVLESFPVGDMNFDGHVNADDARHVLRAAVGLETLDKSAELLADTDNNGVISSADARMVLRMAVGLTPLHYHSFSITVSVRNEYFCKRCEFKTDAISRKKDTSSDSAKSQTPETAKKSEESPFSDAKKSDDSSARRADIPQSEADAKKDLQTPRINIGGKEICLGWSISQVTRVLGKYARADGNIRFHTAYIFNSNPDFYLMVICKDDIVVGAYMQGKGFSCHGISYGDTDAKCDIAENTAFTPFTDSVNGGIVYAMLVCSLATAPYRAYDGEDFIGASTAQIFEMTNVFRRCNGRDTVLWNEDIARVAKLHSEDMAERGFFNHVNPDDQTPVERARENGISFGYYAENIGAGYGISYNTFNQWVNSSGHNADMLLEYTTQLGVGVACVPQSKLHYYWTQNFSCYPEELY